jgi:hypothetical protein
MAESYKLTAQAVKDTADSILRLNSIAATLASAPSPAMRQERSFWAKINGHIASTDADGTTGPPWLYGWIEQYRTSPDDGDDSGSGDDESSTGNYPPLADRPDDGGGVSGSVSGSTPVNAAVNRSETSDSPPLSDGTIVRMWLSADDKGNAVYECCQVPSSLVSLTTDGGSCPDWTYSIFPYGDTSGTAIATSQTPVVRTTGTLPTTAATVGIATMVDGDLKLILAFEPLDLSLSKTTITYPTGITITCNSDGTITAVLETTTQDVLTGNVTCGGD